MSSSSSCVQKSCFYDLEIQSNAKFKPDKYKLVRLQPFHNFELQRSRVLSRFHRDYEKKFAEFFFLNELPKDLMNFFLHEQLSNSSRTLTSSSSNDESYDQLLPKPENILQVRSHVNRIRSFYVMSRNPLHISKQLSVNKFLEKIEPFMRIARHYDENKQLNELLRRFQARLDDENYQIDRKTADEFDAIFLKFATYYEPHIEAKAAEFAEFLVEHVKRVSVKLAEISRKVALGSVDFNESEFLKTNRIKCTRESQTIVLEYEKQVHRISQTYFDKLKALYIKSEFSDSNEKSNEIIRELSENVIEKSRQGQLFLSRVFSMMSRYESYFKNSVTANEGYGFQAALPEHVFAELNRSFGVTEETFASPFNCYFASFCSAFADTDVFFGSRGSFFDYEPVEGSFECNPPFSTDIYDRMIAHIERLLVASSDRPLSFIVFIPERINGEDLNVDRIKKSAFLRETFIVLFNRHRYVSGAQHVLDRPRETKFYDPCHNTQVFFLQNKPGFEKWQPTREKLDVMQNAMVASCLVQTRERRMPSQSHYNNNYNNSNRYDYNQSGYRNNHHNDFYNYNDRRNDSYNSFNSNKRFKRS